jgi:hypothetical protein
MDLYYYSLIADMAVKAVVWLLALLPVLTVCLIVLTKKNCTAEINVTWYAFSLVFVVWWCLNITMYLNIVRLPVDENLLSEARGLALSLSHLGNTPDETAIQKRQQKLEEVRSRLLEGAPWTGRYFYEKAKDLLTNTSAELGLIAIILIVSIVPQMLNYVLAGLSGCAATPRLVWQFEQFAVWSLIKFLGAFGGVSVAYALSSTNDIAIYLSNYSYSNDIMKTLSTIDRHVDDLLWGIGAITLAFVVAVFQVYTLEVARALGDVSKKTESWPHWFHSFFTRNLPLTKNGPAEEAEPETFDPKQLWDTLTPSQQQEIGALIVRSLLDGGSAAKLIWGKLTPAQQQKIGALVVRSLLSERLAANAEALEPT